MAAAARLSEGREALQREWWERSRLLKISKRQRLSVGMRLCCVASASASNKSARAHVGSCHTPVPVAAARVWQRHQYIENECVACV